jgi:hypothetical protein
MCCAILNAKQSIFSCGAVKIPLIKKKGIILELPQNFNRLWWSSGRIFWAKKSTA